MDYHPIQGGVEILPVASCYRNWDKLQPDWPLGPNAEMVHLYQEGTVQNDNKLRCLLTSLV